MLFAGAEPLLVQKPSLPRIPPRKGGGAKGTSGQGIGWSIAVEWAFGLPPVLGISAPRLFSQVGNQSVALLGGWLNRQ